MKHFDRKKIYRACAAALCGALALGSGAGPFGAIRALASPEFARTAEEWAVLRDNVLTWDEIPGLVNEYNATVRKNQETLADDERRIMDEQEVRSLMIRQADDYDSMAIDIEEQSSAQAAQYRALANSARNQADDNVLDGEILKLNYDQMEANIVLSARSLFLAYYSAMETDKKAQTALELQRLAYDSARVQYDLGMTTLVELLTAEEALRSAEAATITSAAAVDSAKRTLSVTCGWAYDGDAEIGPLPDMDLEAIAAIDLAADTTKALETNYTLNSDRRMLQNTRSSNNWVSLVREYEDKIDDDTDQVKASMRSAYDALINAKNAYDNASSARQLAEQDLQTAERNLALGTISNTQYQTSKLQLDSLRYDEELARIAVMDAWTQYDAAVAGLAQAGTGA